MTAAAGTAVRWRVAPLSVVPQGDEYLVGREETGVFVLLPAVGVQVITAVRAGHSMDAIGELARESAGEDVDVESFLKSLQDLDFAFLDELDPDAAERLAADGGPAVGRRRGGTHALDALARLAFGRIAWLGYAVATGFAIAALIGDPRLWPSAGDLFFLSTPALSLAALTAMIYLLAMAHEGAHWLAARSVGVRGRIAISRRLYALTLETDLTGLWSVPRRRRFGPLLAGMTFDAVVLAAILGLRLAVGGRPGPGGAWLPGLLAALTVVQISAIGSQWCVFLRTDVYALLVAATGCVDLYRTTQLSVLAAGRLASARQRAELAAAPERDVRVARWYRWLWLIGMALAAWFFIAYIVPATTRTTSWVVTSIGRPDVAAWPFWEALALGVVLLSPTALTACVLARDGWRWTRRVRPQP